MHADERERDGSVQGEGGRRIRAKAEQGPSGKHSQIKRAGNPKAFEKAVREMGVENGQGRLQRSSSG